MSSQSNALAALKALLHGTGANVADAKDQVTNLFTQYVVLTPGHDSNNGAVALANSQIGFSPASDMKLVGLKLFVPAAITNAAADTITVNVTCNGTAVLAFDSDATAGLAANSVTNLAINTANSFINAGTTFLIEYDHQTVANQSLSGAQFTLVLQPV